ncbi:MAG: hypothetical protein AAGA92_10015 [Planctomycetota bacterium]
MDTTDYPSMARLSQMHALLSVQARRAESVVDSMLDGIERLIAASAMRDWSGIAEATAELADLQPDHGNAEIVRHARHVVEELQSPHRAYSGQPRHLPQLLAACRAVRTRPRPRR